ncbi:universal stress protein [Streptomyces sp. NBC_01216]|uniref:universal stress protein n=1 Tax=Streptomyces sp. NBC_01216 TaxID=2903778 RepID=UPI002E10ED48|nr:universal stress protein [Streptomyces sp. NBC_01216]
MNDGSGEVVLGVDPRAQSVPALLWAADEALRRGRRLRLVVAVPAAHDPLGYPEAAHRNALRTRAEMALANAEDVVHALHRAPRHTPHRTPDHGGPPTTTELAEGTPAAVLLSRAARTDLLVVGSRAFGRPAEMFGESSVAVPAGARADCPVVVVRAPERTTGPPPCVVVGVDGSEAGRAAVGFAFAQAALRGARLRALWVWPRSGLVHENVAHALAAREDLLADSVAEWAGFHPDVDVVEEVARGHPVEELTLASRDALAVVVGRRGRGGYDGMRLGSTAHGLLRRADSPVIVVPAGISPDLSDLPAAVGHRTRPLARSA